MEENTALYPANIIKFYFIPFVLNIIANITYAFFEKSSLSRFIVLTLIVTLIFLVLIYVLFQFKIVGAKKIAMISASVIISVVIVLRAYDWYGASINRIFSDRLIYENSKLVFPRNPTLENNTLRIYYKIHPIDELFTQPLYACIGVLEREVDFERSIYCYESIELEKASGIITHKFNYPVPKDKLVLTILNKPKTHHFFSMSTDLYNFHKTLKF